MSTLTKVVIVVALVVAVGLVVGLKQKQAPASTPEPTAPQIAETETPQASLQVADAVPPAPKAALPRLVDLGADKCIPCIQMAPMLAELKTEYAGRLRVDFIDVWKNPEAAEEHGIQMIPTQIFFDAEGNELFRHIGFFSKEDILATWKELGIDLSASSQ